MSWTARGLQLLLALVIGCTRPVPPTLRAPDEIADVDDGTTLRLHAMDGSLYVLDHWNLDGSAVVGSGRRYDAERQAPRSGTFAVPLDVVAVVETRGGTAVPFAGIIVMSVATGAEIGGTVACGLNPKACFGSCPTFYVPGPDGPRIQAEGFSASIARVLEADDLDALPDAVAVDGVVTIEMRNEALESHAIRSLELLWADGPPGTSVVATPDDEILAVGPLAPPTRVEGGPDDAVAILTDRDARELDLGSDPADLAARTELILEFPHPEGTEAAVLLTVRNTLASTFVLYHLLALLGEEAGAFLARVERGDLAALGALWGFGRLFGGIEVDVRDGDGSWIAAGTIAFTGPIARSDQALRVPAGPPEDGVGVRLRFARSHWRIDRVGLAPLVAELQPSAVAPSAARTGGGDDPAALASVQGRGERLVTGPGDRYEFTFGVPDPEAGAPRGYFLRSRGYYYEWIREAWLAEQDPAEAERLLADPGAAARELAPAWAELAPAADAVFEASRFSGRAP